MSETAEQIKQMAFYQLDGADALRFLNNYCTADLKSWDQQEPIEGMLLDVKGRLVALTSIFATETGLGILAWGKPLTDLAAHLDRYIFGNDKSIRELPATLLFLPDGQLNDDLDVSDSVSSPKPMLSGMRVLESGCWEFTTHLPGRFLLMLDGVDQSALLERTGIKDVVDTADVFHRFRIAAQYPLVNQDTVEATLVQELARDDVAVSFTKGCYLGQETVARLDARGHVNWLLTPLFLESPLPDSLLDDSALTGIVQVKDGDAVVGTLTSVSQNRALGRLRSEVTADSSLTIEVEDQPLTTARVVR